MIYFLHIPKTAGSSLRQVVEANYASDEIEVIGVHWTNWLRSDDVQRRIAGKPNIKAVHGHFSFGLHEDIGGPARYVTFLRRPRERVISGYFHLRRHPKNPLRSTVEHMTLEDYIASELVLDADNGMVRRVSGVMDTVPFGEVTETHLEQAISNIDTHFVFAGTLENFDASLYLLSERLSWRRRHYSKERQGTNRRSYQPEDETVRMIDELNRFDTALYDAVATRLADAIEASDFNARAFERVNRLYNLALTPAKTGRKARRKLRALRRKLFGTRSP
jgi:hypothetical protein